MSRSKNWKATAFFAVCLLAASAPLLNAASQAQSPTGPFQHVLLVSIDGMHAVDYLNCSQGVKGINGGQPYCSNLAKLGATAVNYLDTSTSRPSDSFPGLMSIPSSYSVVVPLARPTVQGPPLRPLPVVLIGGA